MANTETVKALINAFNVHNYNRNIVETNFTLQSRGGEDCIVVSFDKGMNKDQCKKYLDSIKRKIICEFYGIEESNDAEILDTAKLIFDVNSFPFDISERDWPWDEQHGFRFVTPVDEDVIFNLKSHLAFSLKKDVQEGMSTYITPQPFDKEKYLWHGEFPNKQSCQQFKREFLLRMRERYGYKNIFKDPLKVKGNSVYINDVFDDARFIDSVVRYKTWLEGMYLGVDSKTNHRVKLFKDMIIESIGQSTGVTIYDFVCASPLNKEEASILIPLVLDSGRKRTLTKEEALELNCAFNYAVFNDLYGKTQGELFVNGSSGIYGIDFSNKEISHCVITKIIESSVINKDHELSIGPERALSPVQSPFNSPTHAEPPRTPPEQTGRRFFESRGDSDSGLGDSPPQPKDSVAHSPSGDPRSFLEQSQAQRFPMQSHGKELGRSPRQGSEKPLLHDPVNLAGPSKRFSPWSHLSSPVTNPHSSKCVGAVQNVQAGTSAWSQPIGFWSLPAPSAEPSLWQPSRPSSWKGANPVGANPLSQQIHARTLPTSNAELRQQSQVSSSEPSSSKGTDENMRTGKSTWYVSSSGVEDVNNVEPEKQQVSDERSETKPQKNESPKKHGGGLRCSKRQSDGGTFLEKMLAPFRRNNKERGSVCSIFSSASTPGGFVTKGPHLSERPASGRKAKSNSPSKVTSPTHEGAPGGLKSLTSAERNELRPFFSYELQKKLYSTLSPYEEQFFSLIYTFLEESRIKKPFGSQKNDKSLINSRVDSPDIKKHLQEEKEVFV